MTVSAEARSLRRDRVQKQVARSTFDPETTTISEPIQAPVVPIRQLTSEPQMCVELNDAGSTCAGQSAKVSRVNVRRQCGKIGVVRRIEGIDSKLQLSSLGHREVLADAEV